MSTHSKWILNKSSLDLPFILLPGMFGILLSLLIKEESYMYVIYAFIALVLIDSSHVYITIWRTLCRKEERQSHPTYWLTPLLTCVIVFLWLFLKIPYFWSFIVYFTLYHHMRQFYGILRWYQKLNKRFCKASNNFLYLLTVFPFIIFHFRDIHLPFYTDHDILQFPNAYLFKTGIIIYCGVILTWIGHEVYLYKKGLYEINRFLAILTPAIIYGYGMLIGTTVAQSILPLVIAHGVSYFAILDVSLQRVDPEKWKNTMKAIIILFISGGSLALVEHGIVNYYLTTYNYEYVLIPKSIYQYIVTALLLTPLICHFVWDSHIWTGKHKDAKKVFQ